LAKSLQKKGVRTWVVSKSIVDQSGYRNGFWVQTLNRFFALEEFYHHNPVGPILHVEADVLLFPVFPLEEFDRIPKNIAFPLSDLLIGVASTFWLRTYEDAVFFCDFLRQTKSSDPNLTDTAALGLFAKNHAEKAFILRSGLNSETSYHVNPDGLRLSGDGFIFASDGIFDASTLGIYLCGTDPRNSFGMSYIFSSLGHHRINPRSLTFESKGSVLFAKHGSEVRPIYSLHNHSKNARLFKVGVEGHLLRRYHRSKGQMFWRFSWVGFSGFVFDYLQIVRFRIKVILGRLFR
jgi:hypothetical protein